MTIPYTSFQNGAVERAHRTIAERTRCLPLEGRVPPSLWTEAVSCAVYLINILPVPGRHGDIPYCLWLNTPPSPSSPWTTFVVLDVPRMPHYQKHCETANWHRQLLQAHMSGVTWTIRVIAYISSTIGEVICVCPGQVR